MGFAAGKGKLVEVDLTTEIGQDGMLFITNMISQFSFLHITQFPHKSLLSTQLSAISIN